MCLELRPLSGPPSVIRVDPAPGFASLGDNEIFKQYGFAVEVGLVKNPNKNPVAEKCVAELGDKLLRVCPEGGTISPLSLAVATANLNTRIHYRGLSAREMWLQSINSVTHRSVIPTSKLSDNSSPYGFITIPQVRDLTETTSNLSLHYSSASYPEDTDEEPLTSEHVDKEPASLLTPQSTPSPAPAVVPSKLATSLDPQPDIHHEPESSPPQSGSMTADVDACISEPTSSPGPRRSSRSTRRPAYLKDYITY